ncbi:MAG: LCP family protein [Lachnospiraceae bacterium]|nr:LCP family protein [Lachnospiraceae bacterium]
MSEKTKKKKNPVLKAIKIILLVLLCLILAIFVAVYGYFRSKFALVREDGSWTQEANTEASGEQEGPHFGEVAGPSGSAEDTETEAETLDPAYGELESKEVIHATGEVKEDKEVFNLLLIGSDERTGVYSDYSRGDTCMLLSINTSGEVPVISLVSLQRDMAVQVLEGEFAGEYDKLTHTFRYGGADLMMRQVQEAFKVDVDYYVRINFEVFKAGIDAIGGVDVYMDDAEVTYFHDGHISSDVFVGTNHLNGELALAYSRLREIDDDWHRIQRQREVVIAALQQVRSMSLTEIDALIDTLLPMVRTNLTEWKVAQLLLLLPSVMNAEIQQMSIPVKGTYGSMIDKNNRYVLSVDFETNSQILHDFLYGEGE